MPAELFEVNTDKDSDFRKDSSVFHSSLRLGAPDSHGQADAEAPPMAALYRRAYEYLQGVFKSIRTETPFSVDTASSIVRDMVSDSRSADDLFIHAIHHDQIDDYYIFNCVNVAIYVIKMGDVLGFDDNRLIRLGTAALLHDVGMGLIPERLIFQKARLPDRDRDLMRKRPVYSHQILKTLGEPYAWLADCALQVHERFDGSGYPKGIKGSSIDEMALLIGLADMYEALIHSRPQGERFGFSAAMKETIRAGKGAFPRQHLKALLQVFSFFPTGSYVKLNSGAVAWVIQTYPNHPLRPRLRIVYDAQRRQVLSDQILDLPENALLHIVDSISDREIRAIAASA